MTEGLNIIARDKRVRDYILPRKVTACEGDILFPDRLLKEKPLQITTREADCTLVKGRGFIVLDFGKEFSGGVRILTHRANGLCKARLRFGESMSETYAELKGGAPCATATNDHSVRDFVADLGSMSDMQFGGTGFRFIRIDFLSGFEIRIKSILGVFEHLDLKPRGKFSCSDPLINQIFDASAYTLGLCMQNMIWDGIKRDRLVWIGDMHPETLSITALFGAHESVEQALSFEKDLSPLPGFMNDMAAYSLWWLCSLSDYYLHNANLSFLEKHKEYIIGLVRMIDSLVDGEGVLRFNEGLDGFFLDWQTSERMERKAGVYALCAYAMEKTKLLLNALRCDTSVAVNIQKRLKKDMNGGAFKQVNAFCALAGHTAPAVAAPGLLSGGARGMSTFMSFYILSALSEAGRTAGALGIMKEYYGAMLSRGATTFWEDFNMDWLTGSNSIDRLPLPGEKDIHGDYGSFCYTGYRHSLCHGWSSGPVPYLMRYVLGVKEIDPGCVSVCVKPDLADLEFAEGVFPTPLGDIKISHKKKNGLTVSDIDAPVSIRVIR